MESPKRIKLNPALPRLLLNDDQAEKSERRLQRSSLVEPIRPVPSTPPPQQSGQRFSAPFRSPFANKSAVIDKETLNDAQLAELYTETIRLAAAGKINQKNTWSIRLIDYIDDLLSSEKREADVKVTKSSSLFRKASNAIDASIKIYSSRVDSVHSQLYKILGGLNSTDAIKDGANAEDSAEAADKPVAKRPAARQKPVETLLAGAKAAAVLMTEADLCYEVDPMFFKMASAFDEGGAKGLMLNRLQVGGDLTIVFDSDAPLGKGGAGLSSDGAREMCSGGGAGAGEDADAAQMRGRGGDELGRRDGEQLADVNIFRGEALLSSVEFRALMDRAIEAATGKQLCPLLTAFGGEIREAKAQIAALRGGNPERSEAVSEDEHAALDTEANREAPYLAASMFGGDGEASSEDGEGELAGEAVIRTQSDISFTARDGEDECGVGRSWELLGDAFLNWAGPSHWRKLKRARGGEATSAPSLKAAAGESKVAAAKRDAESFIDFETLLSCAESLMAIEADEGVRRKRGLVTADGDKKGAKTAKPTLKRRKTANSGGESANTLPVDMHLDAGLFVRPFYRPHLVGKQVTREVALRPGSLAAAELEPEKLGLRWYNYDNPNDRRYCAQLAEGGADADLAASSDAEADGGAGGLFGEAFSNRDDDDGSLHAFSHMSRQVDVHKLKLNLLRSFDGLRAKKLAAAKAGYSKEAGAKGGDTEEAGGAAGAKGGDTEEADAAKTEDETAVRFSKVVKEMRRSNRSLEQVSVHYCFVSLLHLANERGMEMSALALSDFDVVLKREARLNSLF